MCSQLQDDVVLTVRLLTPCLDGSEHDRRVIEVVINLEQIDESQKQQHFLGRVLHHHKVLSAHSKILLSRLTRHSYAFIFAEDLLIAG